MEYTITNAQRRGEWNMNGNPMQDYAITLEGETNKGWIKLTQKPDTQPPKAGDVIFGQIEKKQTRNGNEYWKFKKLPREGGGGFRGGGGGSSIKQEDIDYIIMMLEELTLRRVHPDNPKPRSEKAAEEPSDGYDDPFAGLV